jgi:hypothetical protein
MKTIPQKVVIVGSAFLSAWMTMALVACDVDEFEDGELPDVKMKVDGEAKLPKYTVDIPKEEANDPNNTNAGK